MSQQAANDQAIIQCLTNAGVCEKGYSDLLQLLKFRDELQNSRQNNKTISLDTALRHLIRNSQCVAGQLELEQLKLRSIRGTEAVRASASVQN